MQWLQPQSAAWCWSVCLVSLLTDDPRRNKISIAPVSSCELFSTSELFKVSFHLYDCIIVLQHGPCRLWISTSRMMLRHGWDTWGTSFSRLLTEQRQAAMGGTSGHSGRLPGPPSSGGHCSVLPFWRGLGWSLCGPSFWGRWNCV